MKIQIIVEMELEDEAGDPLSATRFHEMADISKSAIQNNLFGAGFLPPDVCISRYDIRCEGA